MVTNHVGSEVGLNVETGRDRMITWMQVLEKEPVDCSLVTEMADMYSWGNGNNGQLGLPAERAFKTFMTPQVL